MQKSTGSVRDSYDDAPAETINDLYEAEVVHRCVALALQDIDLAMHEWVHWYNHRLLLGCVSPAEAETAYN